VRAAMAANSTAGSAGQHSHVLLGRRTEPKRGDCRVFCSNGSLPCPSYPSAASGICECTNVLLGAGRKSARIWRGGFGASANLKTITQNWVQCPME
jgi:hypothetical protein